MGLMWDTEPPSTARRRNCASYRLTSVEPVPERTGRSNTNPQRCGDRTASQACAHVTTRGEGSSGAKSVETTAESNKQGGGGRRRMRTETGGIIKLRTQREREG